MQANSWAQLSVERNKVVAKETTPKKKPGNPGKHVDIPEQKNWPMPSSNRRTSLNGIYEIATDIPVDDQMMRHDKRGYPYRELEVGESFWVPLGEKDRKTFRIQNKIPGRRFTGRTRIENGERGARVWRTR